MRTVIASHELLPRGLKLESLSIETGRVSISVGSDSTRSPCPVCGHRSARAHSRYLRTALLAVREARVHVELLSVIMRQLTTPAACEPTQAAQEREVAF